MATSMAYASRRVGQVYATHIVLAVRYVLA